MQQMTAETTDVASKLLIPVTEPDAVRATWTQYAALLLYLIGYRQGACSSQLSPGVYGQLTVGHASRIASDH